MIVLLLSGAILVMAGSRVNPLREPTREEKRLLDRLAKLTFKEVINVSAAESGGQGVPQNNNLILSAYRVFREGNGELNLKNRMFGEEGYCGWQYLLIGDKAVELIVDPREDPFAGKAKIASSSVADIRIAFRNAGKNNELTLFSGTNTTGNVLFLQFRLQGGDSYATFQ